MDSPATPGGGSRTPAQDHGQIRDLSVYNPLFDEINSPAPGTDPDLAYEALLIPEHEEQPSRRQPALAEEAVSPGLYPRCRSQRL
jgi:hypothetical protein